VAVIQVILFGMPGGSSHDTEDYPVILHFEDGNLFEEAYWVIPSYPGYVPADMVSEIRIDQGALTVYVDCSDGFQSGPHDAGWIRGRYPRGKLCSFFKKDDINKVFTIAVIDGNVVIEEMAPAGS
jgi:hypothetical protein